MASLKENHRDFMWDMNGIDESLREFTASYLAAAEDGDVVSLARNFSMLRDIQDRLEKTWEPINQLYNKEKMERLPAAFDRAGVPSVNLEEGIRVTVSHKVFAGIKPGMKEQAITWLREHQLGDLVSETVNSSTLSASARHMAEENQELPDDYFNVAVVPNTSVTKTKSRS